MNKEIMELIQPYMDKTLSEGCYVITKDEIAGIETENGTSFDDIFVLGKLITEDSYNMLGYVDTLSVCTDYQKNEYNLSLSNFNNEEDFFQDIPEVEKIFGHYDITAVLKYIECNYRKKYHKMPNDFECKAIILKDIIEVVITYADYDSNVDIQKIHYLQNKPLHLYTEEENKNLLEILNKLN